MKVGDYVRTKNGIIGKVTKEQPFMTNILVFLDNKQGNIIYQSKDGVFKVNHKEDIIKSSPNIIDLIEVGDYVNGTKVIETDNCKGAMREIYLEGQIPEKDCGLYFEEIKSIVTKEQFESMEYKIGE